jgi:hypothetical protein
VDTVTNDHAKFYWEVTGTQTVVSRESHLESGLFNPDNLYSVTTSEHFVAIDLRRATNTPNLARIKEVEREYFQLCASLANLGASPLNNYSTPPSKDINFAMLGCLALFSAFILGIVYYLWKDQEHKKAIAQWSNLKARLDRLLQENRAILNIAH